MALTAVVWVANLGFGFTLPDVPHSMDAPFAWIVLAGFFTVATSAVIHVHFRQESESFDLFDIPVVIGLVFLAPNELWWAQMLGTTVAVLAVRRQPITKAVFNIGLLGMQVGVTAHLFHLAVPNPEPAASSMWAPLLIASLFGLFLNVSFIVAIVSVVEGRLDVSSLTHVYTYGSVVTLTNTGLGIIAAVLLWVEPALLLPLSIPVAALFLAYRAYGAERDQRERIEMLYQSTRPVGGAEGNSKEAITRLLNEAAHMFRARSVELILFRADKFGRPRRSLLINGAITDLLDPVSSDAVDAVVKFEAAEPLLVHVASSKDPIATYLLRRGIRECMVGRVGSEDLASGVLLIGDRRGDVADFGPEDLRLMGTLVNHLAIAFENDRLTQSISEMKRLESSLAMKAHTDGLTGLLNRNGFEDVLERELREAGAGPLSVAFIDLDDFKEVNDSYGHSAGDAVLVAVGERLQAVVRDEDWVARLGGDEFAIILRSTEDPQPVMARILEQVVVPVATGSENAVSVGASVGLAIRSANEAASQLVRNADMAMFAAKAMGKNTWQLFDENLETPDDRLPEMDKLLREAVEAGDFDLHYQPIVDLKNGNVLGVESLLRWRSQESGLLMPADFLRDAEQSGAIVPIERWVIRRASEDLRQMEKEFQNPRLFVTINISSKHLEREGSLDYLLSSVTSVGVEPQRVILEFAENDLVQISAEIGEHIQALRRIGFRVAVDKFGQGDSSMGVVRRNAVDCIKIGRGLVADIETSEGPYLAAIAELAKGLDIELMAEGVETEAQRRTLDQVGVAVGQGFLFARPEPLESAEGLEGVGAEFAGADSNQAVDRSDPDLAVTDLPT